MIATDFILIYCFSQVYIPKFSRVISLKEHIKRDSLTSPERSINLRPKLLKQMKCEMKKVLIGGNFFEVHPASCG